MPVMPAASRLPKVSGAVMAVRMPRQTRMVNSTITNPAPIKPSSSEIMEKIKSVCGSGR
ncbi:hypothetical protein D3C73_1608540 [compost metagenome]